MEQHSKLSSPQLQTSNACQRRRKRSKRRLPDTAVLTGTILVVDDEEMILEMARSILEQSGYTVIMAENGEQAISIFREVADQISAVLLDMTMPVMSGEKTLKLLRAINPDVPVLLSSGFSEIEALERFPGKAVQGFVQKPYTAAHLVEKISGVAAASRSPSAKAGT